MKTYFKNRMRKPFLNKSKYGSQSCTCRQGHIHDSRAEAGYCNQLNVLVRAKEIKGYEIQKTFPLSINGKHICNHRVDFLVTNNDGSIVVEEFKGCNTQIWVIKKRMFEACYPNIEYIVVR